MTKSLNPTAKRNFPGSEGAHIWSISGELLAESYAPHIARDKGNSQRSSTVICPLLRSTTRDHLSQRTNFELTNGRLTDKRRPFTRLADEDYPFWAKRLDGR